MTFISNLIIFIISSVILGIMYNSFVIKRTSEQSRKILFVLTMVIFILSGIAVSVTNSVRLSISRSIDNFSEKIEQQLKSNFPENDFIQNGIDLNQTQDISVISDKIDELIKIIPRPNIPKKISDLVFTKPLENLSNQIKNIDLTNQNNNRALAFIDDDNFITVSSIITFLTAPGKLVINKFFMKVIIFLLIPMFLYILITTLLVVFKKEIED